VFSDCQVVLVMRMGVLTCGLGRAIDILLRTLPDFFGTGLVSTAYHLPMSMHAFLDVNGKGKEKAYSDAPGEDGIYSRHICLEYTPPVALPGPFPRVLTLEGLPLYVASSLFVRHSVNALYTDVEVSMRNFHVVSPPSPFLKSTASENGGSEKFRNKALVVSLLVTGVGRLGLGGRRAAEWDVKSTYTFSPSSGLIYRHTVNSIDPAPHEAMYSALRSSLIRLGLAIETSAEGDCKVAVNLPMDRQNT